MAHFSEMYKHRVTNYLPATAFTSHSVSVKADAQFVLEKIYYIAELCRVNFVLHLIAAVCIDLLVRLSP